MTIGEKLKFNRELLDKYFSEWIGGPVYTRVYTNEFFPCDRDVDTLLSSYASSHYKEFLRWMFSEYNEYKVGDITIDGKIVISPIFEENVMKFYGIDIFSTGWAFHLDNLKSTNKDISKPFNGYENSYFNYSHKIGKTKSDYDQLIKNIDRCLHEHDPNWIDPYTGISMCVSFEMCKEEDKVFYYEYDKVLRMVKNAINDETYKLTEEQIDKIVC